jgi:hypothetical protein
VGRKFIPNVTSAFLSGFSAPIFVVEKIPAYPQTLDFMRFLDLFLLYYTGICPGKAGQTFPCSAGREEAARTIAGCALFPAVKNHPPAKRGEKKQRLPYAGGFSPM